MSAFSESLDGVIAQRSMLAHPFYQAWEEGRLSQDVLRSYAQQYFHHVEAFPRAVSSVHALCPDAAGRRMLAENLAEEEGLGEGQSTHAALWLDFAAGLGADEADVRAAALNPETIDLIAAFRDLSRRSYASGLGALYAYESQLPAIAATKIKGLVERYGIREAAALRFFAVHERADVEHSAACRTLLEALPEGEREEALAGARDLASALLRFLDGMQRELVC